jgi:hypothetical protein
MTRLRRNRKLTIMLSKDEKESLDILADDDGLSVSDFVRQFIRQKRAELKAKQDNS